MSSILYILNFTNLMRKNYKTTGITGRKIKGETCFINA